LSDTIESGIVDAQVVRTGISSTISFLEGLSDKGLSLNVDA